MGDPVAMTQEERRETARLLYEEGDTLLHEGEATQALAKFEEAYHHYAPDLHVFNFNIGTAAFDAGRCELARSSLQRFLDIVDEHDKRGEAQKLVLALDRGECVQAEPEAGTGLEGGGAVVPPPGGDGTLGGGGAAPYEGSKATADDNYDRPELGSKAEERRKAAAIEIDKKKEGKPSGMLVGGAVLTAVGGAAIVGGAVSLGLANRKANRLADLASPGATGFPDGNYSDDEVFDLDRNGLPANNIATIALFAGGGVMTAVGVTLIALDFRKRKRGRSADEKPAEEGDREASSRRRVRLVGVGLGPTRTGAAASATVAF